MKENRIKAKCAGWEPEQTVQSTGICKTCSYYDGMRKVCCCMYEKNVNKTEFGNVCECSAYDPVCKPNEDKVNHPSHYQGKIEVIDYIRDKLTPEGFTEYCCGNVLKYISRWRKKDGVQDLKKAKVYLDWMIESAEKEHV